MNPRATRTRPDLVQLVERALSGHDLISTAVPQDAVATRAAVASAVRAGATTVIVVGGDGTIGLAASVLAGSEVSLLPLPGGSTNVFARGLGWPADPAAAVGRITDALECPARRVGLGSVTIDGRTTVACVNVGVGVDAAAVDWVERHPRVKQRLRHLAVAGAVAGPGRRAMHRDRPLHMSIDSGPGVRIFALVGAWARPYAYAGPWALDVLPAAGRDGRLAWMALTRPSTTSALGIVSTALRGGHGTASGTIGGTTGSAVRITADDPFAVQADGEPLGRTTDLRIAPGPSVWVRTPAVTD